MSAREPAKAALRLCTRREQEQSKRGMWSSGNPSSPMSDGPALEEVEWTPSQPASRYHWLSGRMSDGPDTSDVHALTITMGYKEIGEYADYARSWSIAGACCSLLLRQLRKFGYHMRVGMWKTDMTVGRQRDVFRAVANAEHSLRHLPRRSYGLATLRDSCSSRAPHAARSLQRYQVS